ncbi:FecCD family ABC transporter permease [Deinococcus peraridilitoris]|uniref:ABC-type Fe3+-siderophore transport system, permease component n=1 Tax=Deinococcus peraridilitoris (strain DSM 19664 / LMG 22246 / CIP 109416 / KR-200) TaxID=937777 RepID=L0A741_DEIPD|nr:iron ABC transporter permease [Deinococcus peraridilitoris]AFZ69269.1 ABC-type Fe3+-siderophore transport system, permease component [Deinococcus peraridilitoris DSM 19664]
MSVAQPIPTRRWTARTLAFTISLIVLVLGLIASIALGAASIPFGHVAELLVHPNDTSESLIIWTLRLPRALIALLAGGALGVAGALLQGVTRNPLADPGILGVEAGAALAILLMVVFFPTLGAAAFVPLAFAGGAAAAVLTFSIATGVGLTPLRLALSGVAVAAFTAAASRAVQILFEDRAQAALFSLAGSVANRTWEHVQLSAPWVLTGLLTAFLAAGRVNLLSLGEDVARSLGVNAARNTLVLTALAVLLAASAVSVVGPIGFVGLVAPHVARGLAGPDYRVVLPLSALLGSALLVWGDVAARLVDRPNETPVGILITALGAPFFVYLARRLGKSD